MQNSVLEDLKIVHGVSPQALNAASAQSLYIDTLGYSEITLVVEAGSAAAGGTLSAMLKTAATLALASAGTFSLLSGAQKVITTANHKKTFMVTVNLENQPRYFQANLAGHTASILVGASIILSRPRVLPVTQPNTPVSI